MSILEDLERIANAEQAAIYGERERFRRNIEGIRHSRRVELIKLVIHVVSSGKCKPMRLAYTLAEDVGNTDHKGKPNYRQHPMIRLGRQESDVFWNYYVCTCELPTCEGTIYKDAVYCEKERVVQGVSEEEISNLGLLSEAFFCRLWERFHEPTWEMVLL